MGAIVETVHAAELAVGKYKREHPEHCTECDGNGYHVADCPHVEPELPPRPERCRCGARLESPRELESVDRMGYALCDDCDQERADGVREENR